jgi:GT2 family glycosyltransferase
VPGAGATTAGVEPALSVILPYRDAAETLDEAIGSVLAERRVPLELVAIDDGSRDGGPSIVARWAAEDDRVVAVRAGGVGVAKALGIGVSHARAPVLARMDADDVSLPGRFAAQLDALAGDSRLAVVGTRVEAFPSHAVGEGLRRYVAWQNALVTPEDHAREIFVESPLCHPSVAIRRGAFERVGGFRDGPFPEDYDLWLRLDAAGFALAKLPGAFLRWRHREGRVTFHDPRCAPERIVAAKAEHLAPRLARAGRPIAVWGAGPTGKRFARALESHGIFADRFVDIDPKKIGRTRRGAPVVDPSALERGACSLVVAVGARGARDLVRERLLDAGWREGSEFVCVA